MRPDQGQSETEEKTAADQQGNAPVASGDGQTDAAAASTASPELPPIPVADTMSAGSASSAASEMLAEAKEDRLAHQQILTGRAARLAVVSYSPVQLAW